MIQGSEMSAVRTQTPGNYPKENILHTEHGESLKSIVYYALNVLECILSDHSWLVPKTRRMNQETISLCTLYVQLLVFFLKKK